MLFIKTLYLLGLIVWLGSLIFFSLVAAPSLFHALTPELFGKAVAAIFPKYFPLGLISGGIVLLSLIILGVQGGVLPTFKIFLVFLMLGLTFYNGFVLSPKIHSLREEIILSHEPQETLDLQTEFRRQHTISVISNSIVLLLGIALAISTARKLDF